MQYFEKPLRERIQGIGQFFSGWRRSGKRHSHSDQRPAGRDLVRSRPVSIGQSYEPVQDGRLADAMFMRLRRFVYRQVERRALFAHQRLFKEAGKVDPGRPYFFLQPINEEGWLFERSGMGWVVTKAQKIHGQNTFMRHYDAWDIVSLHQPREGNGSRRVSSQRLAAEFVSFAVYEQKLVEYLNAERPNQ